MAKSNTWIYIILAIGIILLLLFLPRSGAPDKNFLEVRLYDANGNLIGTSESFSMVNGIPGVASFDITINVRNTGTQTLSCTPHSLSPTQFDSALTKTTLNVLAGNTVSWTSSRINAAQFEPAPTPDVFSASVTCTWTGTPITKTGSISLTIQPDPTGADFEITLNPGGLGTEYCGDGVCTLPETPTSCPNDCTVTTRVNFRTSDLSYVSGSAIAYGLSTCGSGLTPHGYQYSNVPMAGTCANLMPGLGFCGVNVLKVLSNLPGGWAAGGEAPSLWKPTDTGVLCICDSDGTNAYILRYSTSDPDASKVSSSPILSDASKELVC